MNNDLLSVSVRSRPRQCPYCDKKSVKYSLMTQDVTTGEFLLVADCRKCGKTWDVVTKVKEAREPV